MSIAEGAAVVASILSSLSKFTSKFRDGNKIKYTYGSDASTANRTDYDFL